MHSPHIGAPPPRALQQRQARIQRVLPILPQIRRFLLRPREREPVPAVLLRDSARDARGLVERARGRALELDEEAVFLGPFAEGHPVEIC